MNTSWLHERSGRLCTFTQPFRPFRSRASALRLRANVAERRCTEIVRVLSWPVPPNGALVIKWRAYVHGRRRFELQERQSVDR